MTRSVVFAMSLLFLTGLVQPAAAQHREIPIINTVGRFLGYGYTQGGYHSVTGRPIIQRKLHPASNYRSTGLQYAYQPGYQPVRPRMPTHQPLPAATYGYGQSMSTLPQQPTVAPQPAPAASTAPPVPKEPPPEWLKKYLQQKQGEGAPQPEEVPAGPAEATSPSDRPTDGLLEEPKESLLEEPKIDLLDEPADDLLDDSSNLLDDGEEDLLLFDDDFSTQSVPPAPPVKMISAQSQFNRYRQRR